MIQKPDKVEEPAESHRAISLLPVLKLFEKLLLLKLFTIEKYKLISNHQFSFRRKHTTKYIEQIYKYRYIDIQIHRTELSEE